MARLGIIEFGDLLLQSGDLDPVYIMLWEARLPKPQLAKWLIAYWCLYHVGVASVLSEKEDFWGALRKAVPGTRYPRGTERRHFRGDLARASVECLAAYETSPYDLIASLVPEGGGTLDDVLEALDDWKGFGPWIGFKIGDMLERLDLAEVEFHLCHVFNLYKTPEKGAALMAKDKNLPLEKAVRWAVDRLMVHFDRYSAPPSHNRTVNLQEIETILCKWKSHMGGHYLVGKDTREIREALITYGRCRTAQKLLKAGEKGLLW